MLARLTLLIVFAFQPFAITYGQNRSVPREFQQLFQRLDRLGRAPVKGARFVELTFDQSSEDAWVIEEDDTKAVVLRNDLVPWTFSKKTQTRIPSSWHPVAVALKEVKPKDFEQFCRELASRKEEEEPRLRLHGPEASYRILVAHAAWKKGLKQCCEAILAGEPGYRKDKQAFAEEAVDALAWLHYLRGVNLLMYADRREVLPHLRLAREIAPDSNHAKAAEDLLKHLERMVAAEGETLSSRPATRDIDTTGRVWVYTPVRHKTLHHGYSRQVYLGPRGQEILRPWLRANLEDYLFQPAEAVAQQRAERHAARKTPLKYGNRPGTNRQANPKRTPKDHYTTDSYRRAIERACELADRAARKAAMKESRDVADDERLVPRWHPHQLRHSYATAVRKGFGIEAARVVLGHQTHLLQLWGELSGWVLVR